MSGAICGGVVSQSKAMKDPYAYMMAFVMPDIQYKKYVRLIKNNKRVEVNKLFDKYAMSQI